MRFQTRLFIMFLLLSTIPSLLIGITAYQKSTDMLRDQTERDLNIILAQLNKSIEGQIIDFDRFSMLPYFTPETFSFLNKPYTSPEQWGGAEREAQRTLIRLISAYPSINSSIKGLVVYGMNGSENGYLINGNSMLNSDDRARESAWYQEAMIRKGGFVVTGIMDIQQFKDQFKAIVGSRLILDEDSKPLAVIALYMLPDFIPKLVNSLQLEHVQVVVLDQDSNLVYTSDEKLAQQVQMIPMQQKSGSWEASVSEDANGEMFSGVYLHSDYLNWKVIMGVNKEEMFKGSRSIRNHTIVIVIAMGFAAGAVSWLLARGLSTPISRLIHSMREVEQGKFSVPAPLDRADEIGQLQNSYSKMMLRLDELVQSIEEKERHKRKSELYALRARMQPHFLYNTLNSIRMLALLQQSTQIAKLIHSLNKLLHANMKLDAELISLEHEIGLLKHYVSLMDLRYTNVFEVEWDIPEGLQNASLPPMLLQPLLENAIFHGSKDVERMLHIIVSAELQDEGSTLILQITDDGTGFTEKTLLHMDDTSDDSVHIGLKNVRDRIRLRFGEQYGLAIKQLEGKANVILSMPYITMEEVADDVESARS